MSSGLRAVVPGLPSTQDRPYQQGHDDRQRSDHHRYVEGVLASRPKRVETHKGHDATSRRYRASRCMRLAPTGAGNMWLDEEDRGPIRWVTLRRPERKNAIPSTGWIELRQAFVSFDRSPARVLVITGSGGSFCSGADLDPADFAEAHNVVDQYRRMKVVGETALALHRLTKPTIAAVDGVAAGAGLNLALGCDMVVATDRARFSEIFVRRGLTLDFGGSWLLPRAVGPQRAKEMALSGRIVEAAEALAIGLVLELVPEDRFEARVTELAQSLLDGAPIAQMFAKQGIDRSWHSSFSEALASEGQSQTICFGTNDVVEGVAAFLEKRGPRFEGS